MSGAGMEDTIAVAIISIFTAMIGLSLVIHHVCERIKQLDLMLRRNLDDVAESMANHRRVLYTLQSQLDVQQREIQIIDSRVKEGHPYLN